MNLPDPAPYAAPVAQAFAQASAMVNTYSMRLEDWRGIIQRSNEVLTRDVSTFRRALRYGLVQLTTQPVLFYFERVEQEISQ